MARLSLFGLVLLCSMATDAAAQGFFINPFVGTTLTSPTAVGSSTKPGFGVALGGFSKVVGAETEVAYYPQLLDNGANRLTQNRVVTFSGNTLIGPTIGPVKPYGAIGIGGLYLNVKSLSSVVVPNPESISNTYVTINAGGGVAAWFSPHFGVRGDLRYYRAFGFKMSDVQTAGLVLDHFDLWRAAFGVVATF
jgi:hypothetical protein